MSAISNLKVFYNRQRPAIMKNKTVLTRIISIVRVPSLCFNKDTHSNYDDELQWSSLSVKLAFFWSLTTSLVKSWWTFALLFRALRGEDHKLSSSFWSSKFVFSNNHYRLSKNNVHGLGSTLPYSITFLPFQVMFFIIAFAVWPSWLIFRAYLFKELLEGETSSIFMTRLLATGLKVVNYKTKRVLQRAESGLDPPTSGL